MAQHESYTESSVDLRTLATEASNPRTRDLDRLGTLDLLERINAEDRSVPDAVHAVLPALARVVEAAASRMARGGRLIYIGAGTSGRLGCVDASEMPPTYGVPPEWVQGIIAGGPEALLRSIEGAEDDAAAGVADLAARHIGATDTVVGLSASGRARYVRAALIYARERAAFTACITCNRNSPLIACAAESLVAETGPEVVTGSTRMKAGTAQKLILNMLSTAVMVKLGRVRGNAMLDVQLKCEKLHERARNILVDATGCSPETAARTLHETGGSVRAAYELLAAQSPS
ncbi:MAG: N-acetylmuramic acid 6-phosphate etherase [Planctomycetes bacterium]|nr:N-acetylmuramic acid 6-phosphate etherase [Planctomycetota bacterium]